MQNPHWAAPVSRNACLERVQPVAGREALDRRDARAVRLDREHQARIDAPVRRRAPCRRRTRRRGSTPSSRSARGRRGGPRAACGAARRRAHAARPLTVSSIRWYDGHRPSRRRSPRRSIAVADRPRARGRGASRGGTPGSPASIAATGWRRRTVASRPSIFARSGAVGIGEHAGLVDDEDGPRSEAAVGRCRVTPSAPDRAGQRHRGEVVAAAARPPDVDAPRAVRSGAAARSR